MNASLANPDVAVLSLLAAILLIYYECNRPGSVVPGCAGALLGLLSIHSLSQMPIRPGAMLLLACGAGLVAAQVFVAWRGAPGLAGAALLIAGWSTLLQPFASGRVHPATAIVAGAGLSGCTVWLGRIALRARRNKQSRSAEPHPVATQEKSISSMGVS